MKKRLFIAINLAPELEKQLGYLLDQLRDFSYLKTTAKNQLHLTLAFLGDTDEEHIPELADILDALPKIPFTLELGPPALFPTNPQLTTHNSQLRRPSRSPWPVEAPGRSRLGEGWRGIWLAIKPNPALIQLADNLRTQLNSTGFALDPKPFNGHITLARHRLQRDPHRRWRDPAKCGDANGGGAKTDRISPELRQWLSDWANANLPASPVSEITLYSSQLTPTGPVYTPEHCTQLSSPTPTNRYKKQAP